jgi:hypothetical protein
MSRRTANAGPVHPGRMEPVKVCLALLAAIVFWNACLIVKDVVQRQPATATVAVEAGDAAGEKPELTLRERVEALGAVGAHSCALLVLAAGAVALVVRFILSGRVLDVLFIESASAHKRGLSVFVFNIGMMVVQGIILFALVLAAREGRGTLTPWIFMILALANAVWLAGVWVMGMGADRAAFRGVSILALTSITAGIGVAAGLWIVERGGPVSEATALYLAGGGALALCLVDGVFQGGIYCRRERNLEAVG